MEYHVNLTPTTDANLKSIMKKLNVDEGAALSKALELMSHAVQAKDQEVSLQTEDGEQKLLKIS